jgi:heme-degrading monooxygenase HmoA
MIIEIADLRTRAQDHEAFGKAIATGVRTVLSRSPGYLGHSIFACQETPGRFVLHVKWETVEAHTVGFRQSPLFPQWRAIVGPYFAQPPLVEHFDVVDEA